jgi:hypothetical protein
MAALIKVFVLGLQDVYAIIWPFVSSFPRNFKVILSKPVVAVPSYLGSIRRKHNARGRHSSQIKAGLFYQVKFIIDQ